MTLPEILGYVGALLIGLSLGLIGGGGSILTVPVLVYLFGLNPVLATAYSLFVVGSTSMIGSFTYMRKKLLSYKAAAVFATPAFIAVFLTRKYLVPAIPDPVGVFAELIITKGMAIMLFFAVIMVVAAISMIRDKDPGKSIDDGILKYNYPIIAIEGAVVGVLTGLVGAGGGFLIIPALVLLVRLPMKMAVGTSLLIIAVKSLIGFLGDLMNQSIDWGFLLLFTGVSIFGIFIGSYLSRFIEARYLKKAFGWFVLLMGGYIIFKELNP